MSRGRRETLRSLTTLLVLGSMTMRLLVFSLLTKMSPVSLADPPDGAAIRNAATKSGAVNSLGMSTTGSLSLATVGGDENYNSILGALFASWSAGWDGAGASAIARGQVLLLDRKDFACLDLDVSHKARPPAHVHELCVVGAGHYIGDPQPFIRIHGAILVVLALVNAPIRGANGRQIEPRNRMMRQIPEARGPGLGHRDG